MRIWIGLDKKFTNSADSGLDWIQICPMCIPYLETWGSFSLSYFWRLKFCPQIFSYTHRRLFTCRFYKVFVRYLLCCVRIGLDWIQILGHQLDWTGLGSVAHGFGLDWIVSTQSIPYSVHLAWGPLTRHGAGGGNLKKPGSTTRATSTLAYSNPSPSSHGSEMVKTDRRGLILTKPNLDITRKNIFDL